ncbi:AraC family transcriptional regulator [Desulfovibrio inopinatus]|uniref:AraC family transcriptional regulator n=1 Tax=Desulfovibrio inopinatus TaxID=102109 RepID=UPI000429E6ED|nr:AraC family transcriptional regulator [Desulfovibrio inopinatus]
MATEPKLLLDETTYPGVAVVHAVGMRADVLMHTHRKWVVGVCLAGERYIEFGSQRIAVYPGQIFVLAPHTPHRCQYHGESICLCIDPNMFSNVAKASVPLDGISFQNGVFFESLAGLCSPQNRFDAISECLCLFAVHYAHLHREFFPIRYHPAVMAGIHLVHERAGERLTLDDLAAAGGFSRFYFQRLFKREIGVTPVQYLQRHRTRLVARALQAGIGAAEAAHEAGFADQSHMIRTFRDYVGISPRKFLLNNPSGGVP